jgi:phosphoribosylanthranilate isomerase
MDRQQSRSDVLIVQIYEIQSPGEAEAMIDLGVDHIGTVIVSSQQCQNSVLKATVETVQGAGCMSSLIPLLDDIETVSTLIDFYQPDIIHFCETLIPSAIGRDDPCDPLYRQARIRERFPGLAIMRSIPIGVPGCADVVPSLEWANLFEPLSDYFLTDTLLTTGEACIESDLGTDQPVAGFVGITGQICDWQTARRLVAQSRIPVILAGGIGPGNASQGIARVKPAGIDSCTLTNAVDARGQSIRFKKDQDKVKALVDAARRAEKEATESDKYN